jgi:iron complex transport system substrate-binding protein
MRDVDTVTGGIIDAGIRLHVSLGPGLLESAYRALLAEQLIRRGFVVDREKWVDLEVDGLQLKSAFRIDLLVNELVVVEVKSAEKVALVHTKQVLTYLKCLKLPVGLLMNFGAATMKEGIKRVVNGYQPASPPPGVSA